MAAPAANAALAILTGTTLKAFASSMKKSSRPFRDHVGRVPPAVETCQGAVSTSGKTLSPLLRWDRPLVVVGDRRDVGVVDRARLENEACQRHQPTPTRVNAHAISPLTLQNDHAVRVRKP